MRAEFTNISAAFNLLPALVANQVVAVNSGGTALTTIPGSAISTTGAFTTIFAQSASVTLTLPGVNGTLATTANITTATAPLAPLASPALTGTPTAPTAGNGTNTTQIATTAFVEAAVSAVVAGVSSVNTRTGAVTLALSDIPGAAPLASPALSGTPTAPTATAGTNTTQVATTAFDTAAVLVETNRATTAEALLAPKASPTFTGVPAAPTAAGGTNTTQLATTAFVAASFAPLASPALTGTPTAPTASPGTTTTQLATTAFVEAMPAAPPAIGNTTPNTGAFTTLSASGSVSGAGFTARFASPGPIGNTTASSGVFTSLTTTSAVNIGGSLSVAGNANITGAVMLNTSAPDPIASGVGGVSFTTSDAMIINSVAVPVSLGINTASGTLMNFFVPSVSLVGQIITTGGGVYYNTASDERLKINIGRIEYLRAADIIERVTALWFHWKDGDTEPQPGFFAQQVHKICPWAVTKGRGEPGSDGFVPWQMDASKLMPFVVAYIQGLGKRVSDLEAKRR
jgi:hypothetical protein